MLPTDDLLVLVLVLYSSINEPYKAAFAGAEASTTSWFDIFVDAMFYADMLLTFWTGIDKGYELVMDKKEVVKTYLSGWFVVDLVATVQWALLWDLAFPGDRSPAIRLIRIAKVLRLARMGRLITRLTASWTMHTGFIEAAKFFVYVIIVAHLQACFFYLWPILMDCEATAELSTDPVGSGREAANCIADYASGACDQALKAAGWHWQNPCMQDSWRQVHSRYPPALTSSMTSSSVTSLVVRF